MDGVIDLREGLAVAPEPRAKPRRAPIVLGGTAAALALAAAVVWFTHRGTESTDDAFVEGHVASVSARVPGQVTRVLVGDNARVKVGDLLVELDDRDAKVKLSAAQADLASANANLVVAETQLALTERSAEASLVQARGAVLQASSLADSSRSSIDQARAEIASAESRRVLAELDLRRAERLVAGSAVADADLDAKQALFQQASAAVDQAKARASDATHRTTTAVGGIDVAHGRLLAAEAGPLQIASARAAVEAARARVAQTEAVTAQAALALSYTRIAAQADGVVSRRNVEVGQVIDPARPMMSITILDDVWVVANFKEDQIARVREGQSVAVRVDAFPGRKLSGRVDSLSGASGARFALLPPDNASGNFTKVVQRIPVLVRLEQRADVTLRPGMSAFVSVDVGE